MDWILENIGTILVLLVVLLVIGGAIATVVKNKRSGKSGCGCGCANCALKGQCHREGNKGNAD